MYFKLIFKAKFLAKMFKYYLFAVHSFVLNDPPQVYRLDLPRFEVWIKEIKFPEDGKIIKAPDFERSFEVLKDISFEIDEA